MLELRILSGLHRGTAFPLDGDEVRLGGDAGNDVVLSDPGMPAHAATIAKSRDASWIFGVTGGGHRTTVVAGLAVAVGPIQVGFADEREPWRDVPALSRVRARGWRPDPVACLLAGVAVLAASILFFAFVAHPQTASAGRFVQAPAFSGSAPAPDTPRVRSVNAVVYPAPVEPSRPPFDVLSVRSGEQGFIVIDDGQVLVPGNRRQGYTLERIEPRRLVFSGPHRAELPW